MRDLYKGGSSLPKLLKIIISCMWAMLLVIFSVNMYRY